MHKNKHKATRMMHGKSPRSEHIMLEKLKSNNSFFNYFEREITLSFVKKKYSCVVFFSGILKYSEKTRRNKAFLSINLNCVIHTYEGNLRTKFCN